MTHSDSVASYSEDFSSPSGKSSHSKSSPLPRANQSAAHSKSSSSVTENIVGGDGDGSSIKTDSGTHSLHPKMSSLSMRLLFWILVLWNNFLVFDNCKYEHFLIVSDSCIEFELIT